MYLQVHSLYSMEKKKSELIHDVNAFADVVFARMFFFVCKSLIIKELF